MTMSKCNVNSRKQFSHIVWWQYLTIRKERSMGDCYIHLADRFRKVQGQPLSTLNVTVCLPEKETVCFTLRKDTSVSRRSLSLHGTAMKHYKLTYLENFDNHRVLAQLFHVFLNDIMCQINGYVLSVTVSLSQYATYKQITYFGQRNIISDLRHGNRQRPNFICLEPLLICFTKVCSTYDFSFTNASNTLPYTAKGN